MGCNDHMAGEGMGCTGQSTTSAGVCPRCGRCPTCGQLWPRQFIPYWEPWYFPPPRPPIWITTSGMVGPMSAATAEEVLSG
jgi:hypothetical protein